MSVAERYCERGKHCAQYDRLGGPAKLSKYNSEHICHQCREAGHTKDALASSRPTNARDPYESGLAAAFRACKRDFVIQVFKGKGPFWEAVKSMRSRWSVEPVTEIPRRRLPGPLGLRPENITEENVGQWLGELNAVAEDLAPAELCAKDKYTNWHDFVGACVLYDPPPSQLLEFADIGEPGKEVILSPSPESRMLDKFRDESIEHRKMAWPPVKQMRGEEEIVHREERHWSDLLETVWSVHLKPLGISFGQMMLEAFESDFYREKTDEWNKNKPRGDGLKYYIEVDRFTTEEDVKYAVRMLSAAQEARPKTGRASRDRLTCVEAASLHDEYGWTYEQLAELNGWKDITLASKYVKDGRAILNE